MSRAAIRYAKALFEFATDVNKAEAVNTDMKQIAKSIAGSQELKDFLANPIIKIEIKKSSLEAIFVNVQAETLKLFQLLNANKRFEIVQHVAQQYNILFDEKNGVQVAHVTTAVEITPELEKLIQVKIASITDKKITIQNTINPDIIGGFILRIGDMQYNASVANKLHELKREFSN